MSITMQNVFQTLFTSEVKNAYQNSSMLMNTVRIRKDVQASTVKFPIIGKGIAMPRITQTDVTPMNVAQSFQTAVLTDWNASEYLDIYDISKVGFDERQEIGKAIASAIGRRIDQIVINAVDAGAGGTVGVGVGGANTGLNLAKLIQASTLMSAAGVPMSDRHFAISAYGAAQLLTIQQYTDANYNTVRSLVKGEIGSFMGFNFHVIEDRIEGGIGINTNVRTNYAWHKDAVGLATGLGPSTEVNYIPEKMSWLLSGKLAAGAVVVDPQGVYKIQSYEA